MVLHYGNIYFPNTENDSYRIHAEAWNTGLQYRYHSGHRFFVNSGASVIEAMTMITSGYVGIGITTPEVKLHVNGGSDVSLTSGGYIVSGNTSGKSIGIDDNEIMARDNGGKSVLLLQTDGGDLSVHNNAPGKFMIKDDGKVGVGTLSPSEELHVVGDAKVTSTLDVGSTSYLNGITLDNDSDIIGADIIQGYNDVRLKASSTTDIRMIMYTNGDVCIGVCN